MSNRKMIEIDSFDHPIKVNKPLSKPMIFCFILNTDYKASEDYLEVNFELESFVRMKHLSKVTQKIIRDELDLG